jgi:hypothetical protein
MKLGLCPNWGCSAIRKNAEKHIVIWRPNFINFVIVGPQKYGKKERSFTWRRKHKSPPARRQLGISLAVGYITKQARSVTVHVVRSQSQMSGYCDNGLSRNQTRLFQQTVIPCEYL